MVELFPEGFEEVEWADGVELVAYTDSGGEERLWHAFGRARGEDLEEGWEERWRDFHHPARVGPLWIGAPWLEAPPEATAVVIDPGRAFGTGAHPTTRLCLEFLLELERGSLLDLGCGSGVLSISAAKLGYGPIVALDVDAEAVEATYANAAANEAEVEARVADVIAEELPATDVAVANINLAAFESLAPRLRATWVVGSGYVVSDRPDPPALRHVRRLTDAGWAADLYATG
jgi:ribosomal protein L11 methyltransferase